MSRATETAAARRRSRALALGLLIIVLGIGWLGIVRPIVGVFARQRQEIAHAETMGAEFARIVAERPALERRREVLDSAQAGRQLALAADSDGVAAAGLQRLVKTAIDRSGGTLQSTQVKAIRPDGSYRRVGLRVQMTGSTEELRHMLLALEDNQPLIYGEGLELRSRQQMRSNGKTVTEDRTLEIRLDVYGLARSPP